jgi:hypothetical protein
MQGVLVAVRTELSDLKPFGIVLPLADGIVPVQAFFANQKRFFPTHNLSSLSAWVL